jgi:hypothetical protein
MTVWVKISVDFHSALMQKCDVKSPEYAFLRNGVVEVDDKVVILSQADRANQFISWAEQFYADAAERIGIEPDPDTRFVFWLDRPEGLLNPVELAQKPIKQK